MSLIDTLPTVVLDQAAIQQTIEFLQTGVFGRLKGRVANSKTEHRQSYEFGYTYPDLVRGKQNFKGVPRQLLSVYDLAASQLTQASHETFPFRNEIKNCIISFYGPGDYLGFHGDEDFARSTVNGGQNSFWFGEQIIGIVLKPDTKGRLYLLDARNHKEAAEKPMQYHLNEVTGLAFLLSGENRARFHGVSLIERERLSLTFRTVHFPAIA